MTRIFSLPVRRTTRFVLGRYAHEMVSAHDSIEVRARRYLEATERVLGVSRPEFLQIPESALETWTQARPAADLRTGTQPRGARGWAVWCATGSSNLFIIPA